MINVLLPALGDDISSAVVACWHFQPGDYVRKNDDLVELVTDKAAFNVSSPATGLLKTIRAHEGQSVNIGAALAEIENTA